MPSATNPPPERLIGLMSGTSLDGVDAALIECTGVAAPRLVHTHYLPYSQSLRQRLLQLHQPQSNELERAALIANELSHLYADCVLQLLEQSGVAADTITALGCHGQTIRHQPDKGFTLQLFNPSLLAELTGIAVVCDFRSRDIAAGGQGAPLVPAFHQAVFAAAQHNRIIANIGGIANLTFLPAQGPVSGFDCGPGNALLDEWIELQQGLRFDHNGDWAASGTPLPELLAQLTTHPFFAAPPPKSTGREDFHLGWLKPYLTGKEAPEDVQATLVELTAYGISHACRNHFTSDFSVHVCGGGAHNRALMTALQRQLGTRIEVTTTAHLGVDPDWVEAIAFAWLAMRTLRRQPGNLPEVTGARGPRILGAIYPA